MLQGLIINIKCSAAIVTGTNHYAELYGYDIFDSYGHAHTFMIERLESRIKSQAEVSDT